MLSRPIFLLGYMCSGKTTLGVALAEALDVCFVDLDQFIEERQGCSVADIFRLKGEKAFRHFEEEALNELLTSFAERGAVIALGGGTPCRPGVMEKLNENGITVHLTAPVSRIVERLLIEGDKRPLIAGKQPDELTEYVTATLQQRNGFYTKAQHTFDSSRLETRQEIDSSVKDFINQIIN